MFNTPLFKAQMLIGGISTKALADAQGWSMSTTYRKINGRTLFNTKEIQIAMQLLRLDAETATKIFFTPDLSFTTK